MSNYTENTKTIYEGSDKAAYAAYVQEIARFKAAGNRLDSIVNKGIYAACNQLRATVSLNRINALALALRDSKETTRLAKIQRLPEYIGLADAIAFDKKVGVFYFTNYAAAKSHAPNIAIPAMKYLDWIAENKVKKTKKPVNLEAATKQIATMYKALLDCDAIELCPVKDALQAYLAEHSKEAFAYEELQKIRSSLA